ncbi:MAG TPA: beta-ketoacyl-ACP synthase III, partial [Hyphomicrobium sp.]
MPQPVIAATGIYVPPNSISNEELVTAFNAYVSAFNAENAAEIAAGAIAPLLSSSVEFIEKASGIKSRHVVDKAGILDPSVMRPRIPERANEQISVLAELAVRAAEDAIANWGGDVRDIGVVICAASNMQRP